MQNDIVFDWVIGMDAHARTCDICVMNPKGDIVHRSQFSTSAQNLITCAKKYPDAVFVVEETGMSQWIYEVLICDAADVFISNPKRNKWMTSGPKNDRIDAGKLATMYLIGSLRRVYHNLDKSRVEFKRAVQYRDSIVRSTTRIKNDIKAKFRGYGHVLEGTAVYGQDARDVMLRQLPEEAQFRMHHLYDRLNILREHEKEAEKEIRRLGKSFSEIKQFTKVPGVGFILASTYSGYLQTPFRFHDKHPLWGYFSLKVVEKTSGGKPLAAPKLSREGCMALKNMSRRAFLGALHNNKGDNAIADYYRRLIDRGHTKKTARLTTQRKIVAILWHLWKTGEEYYPNLV